MTSVRMVSRERPECFPALFGSLPSQVRLLEGPGQAEMGTVRQGFRDGRGFYWTSAGLQLELPTGRTRTGSSAESVLRRREIRATPRPGHVMGKGQDSEKPGNLQGRRSWLDPGKVWNVLREGGEVGLRVGLGSSRWEETDSAG